MKPPFKSICVVGLGYVGLPTASVIAGRGVPVLGVDINADTVETINRGRIHIVEPGLEDLVNGAVMSGTLKAAPAAEAADAFIVAVPTPLGDANTPDLSHLKAAAKGLAPVLRQGNLVVIESTSPVGTTRAFSQWLADHRPDLTFPHEADEEASVAVAHSPERVLPGNVLQELTRNDRVVGGISPRCSARAVELYQIFVEGECLITDAATAELVKLAEKCLPGRQHRLCQRAFQSGRAPWRQRLGRGGVGQSPSARRYPQSRPRGGRALYRRRPLVHRRLSPRRNRPHLRRPPGQRRQARLRSSPRR